MTNHECRLPNGECREVGPTTPQALPGLRIALTRGTFPGGFAPSHAASARLPALHHSSCIIPHSSFAILLRNGLPGLVDPHFAGGEVEDEDSGVAVRSHVDRLELVIDAAPATDTGRGVQLLGPGHD